MLLNIGVGTAAGLIAFVAANYLPKKRDEKIWDEVNANRIQINRFQTSARWRKYSKELRGYGYDKERDIV